MINGKRESKTIKIPPDGDEILSAAFKMFKMAYHGCLMFTYARLRVITTPYYQPSRLKFWTSLVNPSFRVRSISCYMPLVHRFRARNSAANIQWPNGIGSNWKPSIVLFRHHRRSFWHYQIVHPELKNLARAKSKTVHRVRHRVLWIHLLSGQGNISWCPPVDSELCK